MSTPQIAVEERQFSLVLALLATEIGLTKTEILSTVQGYRQRFRVGGDNASLERQFERDKDDVRDLGVPIDTVGEADDAAGHHLRYRIPKGAYELPSDVHFTPRELTLLDLAATAWREGSLSTESQRALLKLRSLGVETGAPIIGYAPRIRARDAAFEPLRLAIDRRRTVRFDYLKPGALQSAERRVEPLALVQHQGRWHLYGTDVGAGGRRTFLLRRIVGAVRTGASFEPPADADSAAARALSGLEAVLQRNVAVVRVAPGSDAGLRLAHRASSVDGDRVVLQFTDLALLADELAGFGPEVVIDEPAPLRDAVIERLRAVRDAHVEAGPDRG